MGKSLNECLKDIGKNIEDFFGVSEMDTEELKDAIDNESEFNTFEEMQESIVTEIGHALNEMTVKNYDEAFIILRNLQDEIIKDLQISK